jgi:hypothetical protein
LLYYIKKLNKKKYWISHHISKKLSYWVEPIVKTSWFTINEFYRLKKAGFCPCGSTVANHTASIGKTGSFSQQQETSSNVTGSQKTKHTHGHALKSACSKTCSKTCSKCGSNASKQENKQHKKTLKKLGVVTCVCEYCGRYQ